MYRAIEESIVQSRAIRLATLLCIPAAAALIASAPVTAAAGIHYIAACSGHEIPNNDVRSAGQATDLHAACNADIEDPDATLGSLQDEPTAPSQTDNGTAASVD